MVVNATFVSSYRFPRTTYEVLLEFVFLQPAVRLESLDGNVDGRSPYAPPVNRPQIADREIIPIHGCHQSAKHKQYQFHV